MNNFEHFEHFITIVVVVGLLCFVMIAAGSMSSGIPTKHVVTPSSEYCTSIGYVKEGSNVTK